MQSSFTAGTNYSQYASHKDEYARIVDVDWIGCTQEEIAGAREEIKASMALATMLREEIDTSLSSYCPTRGFEHMGSYANGIVLISRTKIIMRNVEIDPFCSPNDPRNKYNIRLH